MNLTIQDDIPTRIIKSGDAVMLNNGNVYKIYETKNNRFLAFRLNGSGMLGLGGDYESIEEMLGTLSIKKHYPAGEWELTLKRKEGADQ